MRRRTSNHPRLTAWLAAGAIGASAATIAPGCRRGRNDLSAPANVRPDLVVPAGARQVARGDAGVEFTAPADGRVIVFDESARRVILRWTLRSGETFAVHPSRGEASIDGQVVTEDNRGIAPGHTYRLYFKEQ